MKNELSLRGIKNETTIGSLGLRGFRPLLRRLVNGSALGPKKDVASHDRPGLGARGLRPRDFRMGILASFRGIPGLKDLEGGRGEVKHLSTRRKRNQMRCRE